MVPGFQRLRGGIPMSGSFPYDDVVESVDAAERSRAYCHGAKNNLVGEQNFQLDPIPFWHSHLELRRALEFGSQLTIPIEEESAHKLHEA